MRIGLLLAATLIAGPAFAQTVTYNSAPGGGFYYGTGNNYSPANAAVLSTNAASSTDDLALRMHISGPNAQQAPASDASGVYSFALGSTPISYDFSIGADYTQALITVTNVGTGYSASYNPFFPGNDNTCQAGLSCQNSARLNFGFLLGSNFTPNVDSTYSVSLAAGGNTLTTFAKIGAGAVAAVPEPSTWALMLLGFGSIGAAMRRQRRGKAALPQLA